MSAWNVERRAVSRWTAAMCALAVIGGVFPANAESDSSPGRRSGTAGAPTDRAVTLLTGDRVRVVGDAYVIEPGRGRERMVFDVRTVDGHLHVLPADALTPLGSGRLDRRLFDVTTLLDMGYGDSDEPDIPLLVARGADPARTQGRLAEAGVLPSRDLPGIGLRAMRAPKPNASQVWAELADGTGNRVWLDGRRSVSLNRSVPKVGAPTVWAGGYTGRGVSVAVLDTGIDAGHPDLAGRVAQVANFTDDPDATDTDGHGTHVASILAGSGAASGGRYRGVAPDASVLAGKVCTSDGCLDSAILAGMEWAVATGATVVNLSFGGPDNAEPDPVEEAIDALTARHGTLFVAAAGNNGEAGPRTIDSPASADAALAVGAVDSEDQLASFSGRGPSADDDPIKPEITAPGVDIVAALARDTMPGEPVGDGYVQLSGTSMAAPHVAGAAALLAQQHPQWRAAELKASLMGSATPNPDLDVHAQGGGRLDVAAASASTLRADPASLQLGLQRWPHNDDEPLQRTVTYHNDGDRAVPLSVTLDVTAPGGGQPPTGMFTVAPNEITVPAGGTATVTLTADTARNAPEGVYFGHIRAAGGTGTVRTTFAVDREKESHDLALTHLDRKGVATGNYRTTLLGVDRSVVHLPYEPDGTVTLRLPKGRYHLDSSISSMNGDRFDGTKLMQPNLDLTTDTSIVLDARAAGPVAVSVARSEAREYSGAIGYHRTLPTGTVLSATMLAFEGEQLFSAQLGSAVPVPGLYGRVHSLWAVPGSDGLLGDGSQVYYLAFYPPGRLPTGYVRQVKDGELALVHAEHRARRPDSPADKVTRPATPDFTDPLAHGARMTLPARRTEYYTTDGVLWSSGVNSPDGSQFSAPTAYRRGRSAELWYGAPFGPGLSAAGSLPHDRWVSRTGDRITAIPPLHSDATANHVGFGAEMSISLYHNGKPVPLTERGDYAVPSADASYRLEASADGSPELSTRVTAAWTFRSAHVPGSQPGPLPVFVVRFSPALNADDAAPAGRPFTIPLTVQRQAGSASSSVTRVAVEVSYDDGASWGSATVDRSNQSWMARVSHPDTSGFVSLRATAEDRNGNTVRQTIIRAYRLSR